MTTVLVHCANGAQGAAICRVLTRDGHEVRGLVRPNTEPLNLQDSGATVVRGDLDDFNSLKAATTGVHTVVLTLPMVFDVEQVKRYTQNALRAAQEAGCKRVIFNTSAVVPKTPSNYAAIDTKLTALAMLQESNLEVAVLEPTLYLDNLSSPFLLPVIQSQGVVPYPVSADFAFHWISHENLGRFVSAAVTTDDFVGKTTRITNQEKVDGHALAKRIGSRLNKQTPFVSLTPEAFEENLKPVLGPDIAREVANFYRGFASLKELCVNDNPSPHAKQVDLQSLDEWLDSVSW